MAESLHLGSGGYRAKDPSIDGAMLIYRQAEQQQRQQQRPSTATPRLALSHPDRKVEPPHQALSDWKSASLKHSLAAARPAPAHAAPLRVTGSAHVQAGGLSPVADPPGRIFGRVSLYDFIEDNGEAHTYFGEEGSESAVLDASGPLAPLLWTAARQALLQYCT